MFTSLGWKPQAPEVSVASPSQGLKSTLPATMPPVPPGLEAMVGPLALPHQLLCASSGAAPALASAASGKVAAMLLFTTCAVAEAGEPMLMPTGVPPEKMFPAMMARGPRARRLSAKRAETPANVL